MKRKKRFVVISFALVFATIVAVFALAVRRELSIDTVMYYMVAKPSIKDKNNALSEGAKARLKGGAGYLYEKNGGYHVVLSCYGSLEDAESVAKKTSGVDVVKLEIAMSKDDGKNKIQKIGLRLSDKIYSLSIAYDKGEIDEKQLKIALEKIIVELEKQYTNLKKDVGTEVVEVIRFVSAVENITTCNESFISWNLKNQRVRILEICKELEK